MKGTKLDYAILKDNKEYIFVDTYKNEFKDQIICPYCFGDVSFKKGRAIKLNGEQRQSHFFHLTECTNKKVDSLGESKQHRVSKEYMIKLFNGHFPENIDITKNMITNEHQLPQIKRIADVYLDFTYQNQNYKKAIEIQYSNISEEDLMQRHSDYRSQGIDDIRIIGLTHNERGFISNKTSSLVKKVLKFQKTILLISSTKLYILDKFKVINERVEIQNNNRIAFKEIKFKLPEISDNLGNSSDLWKLKKNDIGKEFFTKTNLNIYKKETIIEYDYNENIHKLRNDGGELPKEICKLILNIDSEIEFIKSKLRYIKDIDRMLFNKVDSNIERRGLFSTLLLILKNIVEIKKIHDINYLQLNKSNILVDIIPLTIETSLSILNQLESRKVENKNITLTSSIRSIKHIRDNGILYGIDTYCKSKKGESYGINTSKQMEFISKTFFWNINISIVHLNKFINELKEIQSI